MLLNDRSRRGGRTEIRTTPERTSGAGSEASEFGRGGMVSASLRPESRRNPRVCRGAARSTHHSTHHSGGAGALREVEQE